MFFFFFFQPQSSLYIPVVVIATGQHPSPSFVQCLPRSFELPRQREARILHANRTPLFRLQKRGSGKILLGDWMSASRFHRSSQGCDPHILGWRLQHPSGKQGEQCCQQRAKSNGFESWKRDLIWKLTFHAQKHERRWHDGIRKVDIVSLCTFYPVSYTGKTGLTVACSGLIQGLDSGSYTPWSLCF